jgi:hypothetical protein
MGNEGAGLMRTGKVSDALIYRKGLLGANNMPTQIAHGIGDPMLIEFHYHGST